MIDNLSVTNGLKRWWCWYAGPALLTMGILVAAVVAWFVLMDWLTGS